MTVSGREDAVELEYSLEQEDYRAFNAFVLAGKGGNGFHAASLLFTFAYFAFAAIGAGAIDSKYGEQAPWVYWAVVAFAAAPLLLQRWAYYRATRAEPDGFLLGRRRFECSSEGILVTSDFGQQRVPWGAIQSIRETPNHVFIMLDRMVGHILPKRIMAPGMAERLGALAARGAPQVRWTPNVVASAAKPSNAHSECRAEVPVGDSFVDRLLRNVASGIALALPVRVPHSFSFTSAQLFCGWAICIVVIVLIDFITVPPERYFNSDAVPILATQILGAITALYVAMKTHASPIPVDRPMMAFAFGLILPLVVSAVVLNGRDVEWDSTDGITGSVRIALLTWISYIAYRACRSTLPGEERASVLAGVRVAAILIGVGVVLPHQSLWWHYNDSEEDANQGINVEKAYYAQMNMVDKSLAAMTDERPAMTDFYFVGFAGASYQDVFMKEVDYVKSIVEQRFDAAGRSLTLVNNPATVHRLPLANVHNLEHALTGVAARMDRDDDILLLYLTSHGSDDGKLSVDFWPFGFGDLSVRQLAQMIERTAIRWRIIIVSSCYSGAFIEPLQGPTTLVITAADADSNSFGCSNEEDLTYFGNAYFREGVSQTSSLVKAFQVAKESIAKREHAENKDPSNPQMRLGDQIAQKLAEFENTMGARHEKAKTQGKSP